MKFLKMFSKNIFEYVLLPILTFLAFLLFCIVALIFILLPGIVLNLFNIDNFMLIRVLSFEWIVLIISFACSSVGYPYDYSFKGVLILTPIVFIVFSLISGYIALCFIYHSLIWITLTLFVVGGLTFIVIKSYIDTK